MHEYTTINFWNSTHSSCMSLLYSWQCYHVTPYYTAVALSLLKDSRILPGAGWDVKMAVPCLAEKWPDWTPKRPFSRFVWIVLDTYCSNKLPIKAQLPSISLQLTLGEPASRCIFAVGASKFNNKFSLPGCHPRDNYPRPSQFFPCCKRPKLGDGRGTRLSAIRICVLCYHKLTQP